MLKFTATDGTALWIEAASIAAVKSVAERLRKSGETAGPKCELLVEGRWLRVLDTPAAVAAMVAGVVAVRRRAA